MSSARMRGNRRNDRTYRGGQQEFSRRRRAILGENVSDTYTILHAECGACLCVVSHSAADGAANAPAREYLPEINSSGGGSLVRPWP